MKNKISIIILILVCGQSYAQNQYTIKADKLFLKYQYLKASEEYKKIIEEGHEDSYVQKQLADCYYLMSNSVEAIPYYEKAIQKNQSAETYFRYAQMLISNKEYDKAKKAMISFSNLAPKDSRAKLFLNDSNYLNNLLGLRKEFETNSVSFNSNNSDFGALQVQDKIYFTSSRGDSGKKYGWNGESFYDIYSAKKIDSTNYTISPVTSLNSKYHDGPITITSDGKILYFSSDSFLEDSFEKDKEHKLKLGRNNLYKATLVNQKWENITSLDFNSNMFSNSNPSVSYDNKTLYFSSDRPGGIGGIDIWKVTINDDGTFGLPENLEDKVNTEGNESFPFIEKDNKTLYFASNGRLGLGGLDVFKIDLSATNAEAVNLGVPINSNKDDFYFTYSEEENNGFLSSNRNGNDDIFDVIALYPVTLEAIVKNGLTNEHLSDVQISLLDENDAIIFSQNSNSLGATTFKIKKDSNYKITASKNDFNTNEIIFTSDKGKTKNIEILLAPITISDGKKIVGLNPIYFEFDKIDITESSARELDRLIEIMNNDTSLVIYVKSHTDNRGDDAYNLKLSKQRAKSTINYIISKGIDKKRISGEGFGEKEPRVDCDENCTELQHTFNRRSEFIIVE